MRGRCSDYPPAIFLCKKEKACAQLWARNNICYFIDAAKKACFDCWARYKKTVSPDSSPLHVKLILVIVVFVASITTAVQHIWPCSEWVLCSSWGHVLCSSHRKCIGTVEQSTTRNAVRVAYLIDNRDWYINLVGNRTCNLLVGDTFNKLGVSHKSKAEKNIYPACSSLRLSWLNLKTAATRANIFLLPLQKNSLALHCGTLLLLIPGCGNRSSVVLLFVDRLVSHSSVWGRGASSCIIGHRKMCI